MSSISTQKSDVQSTTNSQRDVHKVKRKPRVVPKTPLERVFGNQKQVKEHYFTAGVKINESNQRDILNEPSPFMRTNDQNTYSYKVISEAWHTKLRHQELDLKYYKRNSYKSRQQIDVLNRLFVAEPAEQTVKTILDIDPEFFTIVEGRPIKEKFNVVDYIQDVREVLRTRIVTGFREDDVLKIEENFIEEQRLIDKIRKQYQAYVDLFEEFLAEDHKASMDLLRESEKEAQTAFQLYEKYRELSKDYSVLKSSVSNLDEKWRSCKLYQKFLYMVSPLSWRKEHDFYTFPKKGDGRVIDDSSSSNDNEVVSSAGAGSGSQPSLSTAPSVMSTADFQTFDDMVETFMVTSEFMEEPLLYFTEPTELLKVFRFTELQNLNALLHSEELAGPLESIKEGMIQAQRKFDDEIRNLNEMIDNLEGDILWEEERAKSLEELSRVLIETVFKKLIAAEEVLNWYVFVEDVYENRIAPNDANLTAVDMMRSIEIKYRNYLIMLDGLPQNKVHKAERECYVEEARVMAIAEAASKQMLVIERMSKRLRRILEPPFRKTSKAGSVASKQRRSTRMIKFKKKKKDTVRTFTTEESELIDLFTDLCLNKDDLTNFDTNDFREKLNISQDLDA